MNIRNMLISATFALGTQTVQAADLPIATRAPAMVAAPLVHNWSGFYVGVYGGYGFGNVPDADNTKISGGIAGGTVGFNYQPIGSPLVVGAEIDGGWAGIGKTFNGSGFGLAVNAETRTDAMATARVRAGAAFDQTLLYVTGGGAWVRNNAVQPIFAAIDVTAARRELCSAS